MYRYSAEDFYIMVDQLIREEPVRFDKLLSIAEQLLTPAVRQWCREDPALRYGAHEADVMQEVLIRLVKTCKPMFLLRPGVEGTFNDDPQGFKNWMYKVASNIFRDYAKKVRRIGFRETALSDEENELPAVSGNLIFAETAGQEKLAAAFQTVLHADAQVYKVLAWIAQFVFVVSLDLTRKQATEQLIAAFSEKSLSELFDGICRAAKQIPWLALSKTDVESVARRLAQPWDAERTYGMVSFQEFFMKKGGKASVSDWVNRLDRLIQRML